ncbi:copper transporter [Proteinivorax hydrogeniformans]|uniref:Copper transporter n=1 Tax=Proteinivorax hydrogeniformans TaxID=1826727 RepID=A0AAU8HQK3_9FIRM
MPSFKFHIVTVISIFVALALGIMVGTTLSDGVISNSQMSTIDLMQNRIVNLEEENKELISSLQETQLLKGNLKKRERDLFYKTLDRREYSTPLNLLFFDEQQLTEDWSYYLEEIDLKINKIVLNSNMEKEAYKHKLSKSLNLEVEALYTLLGKQIAMGINTQEFTHFLSLQEMKLASFEGEALPSNAQTYVFLFKDEHYDKSLAEIANAFAKQGLNVIIALSEDVDKDFEKSFHHSASIIRGVNQSTGLLQVLQSIK